MAKKFENLKVAIITDWLTNRGGGERVILLLAEIFPQADIYTSVYKSSAFPELKNRRVITSHLQKSPLRYRHQLFVMQRPAVFESFNLDEYDLVVSSTSAEAKGVITKPETLHICYLYTPTRYYWSHYHEYVNSNQFGILGRFLKPFMPAMIHKLRMWDRIAADRVDIFVAISNHIKKRIAKYYEVDSSVLYPPVDFHKFDKATQLSEDFYLVLGRQVAYKRTDLVIEAFNHLSSEVKIIGDGPEMRRLQRLAKDKNIEFLGYLPDEEVARYIGRCKALIFPQEEDFGIVPLEAMAAGKPVIAFRKGGATETVIDNKTGILFDEQTSQSLINAIRKFEGMKISSSDCKQQAQKFDKSVFKRRFKDFVERALDKYQKSLL